MTTYWHVKQYFNTKNSGKIFTRAEYMIFVGNLIANSKIKVSRAYCETIRCYLQQAGYLGHEEAGVYRKLKKIPESLSLTQLEKEAYPKRAA